MPSPADDLHVRPAEPDDDSVVAQLLYESAAGRYDMVAGGRDRALRLIRRMIAAAGTDVSRDAVLVADVDGVPAGAAAAFPAREATARRRRSLLVALRTRSPLDWPVVVRTWRIGERIAYGPPDDTLHVDGLATDARFRRRGVARTLLDAAGERAQAFGLRGLALDTSEDNTAAQATYEALGFSETRRLAPDPPLPGLVFYEREAG